jgi:hypothetical protein
MASYPADRKVFVVKTSYSSGGFCVAVGSIVAYRPVVNR